MTTDQVLDRCRTEWMFNDIPEPEVEDMLAELRDHLDDAARAGKLPTLVVGKDVTAFASTWADEHRSRPPRRSLRELVRHAYAGGAALLLGHHVIGWSTTVEVVPGTVAAIALFGGLMTFTPYWRCVLHWPFWKWMALSYGLCVVLLALFFIGSAPVLLNVPLWGTALLLLPAVAAAVGRVLRTEVFRAR
ncbi:hypothetical protein RI138_31855 [Streptomyces sp. C11-1]|uniref:Integral membrane protein n=1 Tax=Streptomyces durocortorensis TaxID=2811104 RepID=A0ABY9W4I9_9ACTN|nr:hypothetical protein [Streptomyces durocortorensis]WNF31061.1 hypothetical protein RI138_31855 [Streptomyces durocortorensis]